MESNEIKAKELLLKQQLEELKKQEQEALVREGKAYHCKNPHCKIFVSKENEGAAVIESGLCSTHFHIRYNEERKQEILKKIKWGRIVDIEINNIDEITSVTVLKNGMLYDLTPRYDCDYDDVAKIIINHEYKDTNQYKEEIVDEIKPWQKERCEKPLVEVE